MYILTEQQLSSTSMTPNVFVTPNMSVSTSFPSALLNVGSTVSVEPEVSGTTPVSGSGSSCLPVSVTPVRG